MIQKNYKLWILALMLSMPFLGKAVTITDSAVASNVQVCLQREIVRLQFSVGGTGTTGSYLDIKLPIGFSWEGLAYGPIVTGGSGSNTITYSGLVAGKHRLTFGSSTASQTIRLGFWQRANCSAGTSSFTTRDSLFFYEGTGSLNISATNLFNGIAPDLSITALNNSPEPSVAGSTVTRTYTITNGGFGATSNFRIIDDYYNGGITIQNNSFRINPSGVNYSINTSRINDNGDSAIIRLGPTEIQQIGDGDTLFENGESFILRYTFNTNNCGNMSNQFPGDVSVNWLCSGSIPCAVSTAIYTNSVTIPAGPNLISWGKRATLFCTDGGYNVDTFYVRNTGGLATEVNLAVNNTWNNTAFDGNHGAYWDTANIFYKRGKNGIPQRFYIQSGTITNGSACGISGVARGTFLPININTNDTIIIIIPRRTLICQVTTCGSSSGVGYPGFSGLAVTGNYKNACANSTFNLSANMVIGLNTYQLSATNNGNSDFYCGQNGQLVYPYTFLGTQLPRTKLTMKINLPAQLALNPISGVTAYLFNGTTYVYPNQVIGGDSFVFNSHGAKDGYSLYVNVTGSSSTAYCSNLIPAYLKTYFNPDTLATCNRTYPMSCVLSYHNFFGCGTACCSEGIYTLSLSAYRENIGLRDDNNDGIAESGKADSTKISRNLFWHSDTMLIKTKALVKTNTLSSFDFAYFKTGLPFAASRWNHIGTTVKQWGPSTSLNTVSTSLNIVGDSIVYDISANNYVDNDTIELISRFVVNYFGFTNTGLASFSGTNLTRWYGSTVANPTWSQRYSCNEFTVSAFVQPLAYLSNSSTQTVNGCAQIITNHDLSVSPNTTRFPYEVRPFKIPLALNIKMPTGYSIDSVVYHSNTLLANRTKVNFTISGDSIRVNLSTLFVGYGGTFLPESDDQLSYMRIWMKPTCQTPSATINGGIRFVYNFPNWNRTESLKFSSPIYTLNTTMPSFTANSPDPIAEQYSKKVNWEVTNTNISAISAPNGFAYLRNNSGTIVVDSVKLGNTLITANGNGFFNLGTYGTTSPSNAKTLKIFGTSTGCNLDSLEVFFGFDCSAIPTSFTNNICGNPFVLYVQPQVASIQTQITSLASTPSDPANPSAGTYGGSTIFMCRSIPFEMEIQSTQTGNIYNVSQSLTLPFNGASGLNYVSDSGYIEYPIGTTPRPFSATANAALITQAATGTMTLSLNQIDPDSFNNLRGLLGTGLGNNNTRRVLLRWKMRSNCDLVSGDQWQATQSALSPCGSLASGSTTTTSGYSFNLDGVTRPYVATVRVSTGLDGCGAQTTQIRLEKTGGAPPAATDSITIRLPKLVVAGTMTCSGINCPGGTGSTQAYSMRTDALYQYITFQYPNTAAANGDTLLYSFPMTSRSKSTCENNQNLKADVFQQLTVYCGAPIPANLCPNAKLSLGSETKSFDIRKAILQFNNYSSEFVDVFPRFKYRFIGDVNNMSAFVGSNSGVTLNTFFDINNNLIYDKGVDELVKTTVLGSAINPGGFVSFADSFVNINFSPSPNMPMYTVIDTGDASANCFCGGVVMSAFNQALPIRFLNTNAINLSNKNAKISWTINAESGAVLFNVLRKAEGETIFVKIGVVKAKLINGVVDYVYFDNISNLPIGNIQYQIEAISQNQESKFSQVMPINKTELLLNGQLFNIQPNPANQSFQIQMGSTIENGTLKVFDMNGQLVFEQNINQNIFEINTSTWSSGVYTIRIENAYTVENQKLNILR